MVKRIDRSYLKCLGVGGGDSLISPSLCSWQGSDKNVLIAGLEQLAATNLSR